jgi:hypothetical protein
MRRENSNGIKALFKVSVGNVSLGINIKDSEGIEEIEVRSLC